MHRLHYKSDVTAIAGQPGVIPSQPSKNCSGIWVHHPDELLFSHAWILINPRPSQSRYGIQLWYLTGGSLKWLAATNWPRLRYCSIIVDHRLLWISLMQLGKNSDAVQLLSTQNPNRRVWYSLAAINTGMNECEGLHFYYQDKPELSCWRLRLMMYWSWKQWSKAPQNKDTAGHMECSCSPVRGGAWYYYATIELTEKSTRAREWGWMAILAAGFLKAVMESISVEAMFRPFLGQWSCVYANTYRDDVHVKFNDKITYLFC